MFKETKKGRVSVMWRIWSRKSIKFNYLLAIPKEWMGLGAVPCFIYVSGWKEFLNAKQEDWWRLGRRPMLYLFFKLHNSETPFSFLLAFLWTRPKLPFSLSRSQQRCCVYCSCVRWWTFLIPLIIAIDVQHVTQQKKFMKKKGSQPITPKVLYWPCHLNSPGFAHRNFITPQRATGRFQHRRSRVGCRDNCRCGAWGNILVTWLSLFQKEKKENAQGGCGGYTHIYILAVPRARRNHSLYIVFRE